MSESGKILAIIEPDVHPTEVVERATWLAKLTDCDLDLFLCDPDIGALREGFFISNEARDIAEKIARQLEIQYGLSKLWIGKQ